ncbi:hypothetical protein Tsubulata_012388 [Turnera subulata]|uniref:RRM domain-containing protein n=1 Tax=Turnera subulata TaxID=218843 RepID=A0A9Q0JEC3_9ROSI|nr:hypothetical protein Tsubulata_012388 [Turnera subulata]
MPRQHQLPDSGASDQNIHNTPLRTHPQHVFYISTHPRPPPFHHLRGKQRQRRGGGEGRGEAQHGNDEVEEPVEKLLVPFGEDQLISLLKRAIDKHPDLMNFIREVADADPAHRKSFVHGLGGDTTTETLKSKFSKYGEIKDCKAVMDRVSGKFKGYAFIL